MKANFFGRLDRTNPAKPAFSWPGCELQLLWRGAEAPRATLRVPPSRFLLEVRVMSPDGSPYEPKRAFSEPVASIQLAFDAGEREIDLSGGVAVPPEALCCSRLILASEPFDRPVAILECRSADGSEALDLASLSTRPTHRPVIEFVGDSLTVGYGLVPHCEADPLDGTDHTQGYAFLASRELGADHLAIARSGKGIVRNWNGGEVGETMPDLYEDLVPRSGARLARDAVERVDLAVVALGANDFSEPLHAGEAWSTQEELRADFAEKGERLLLRVRALLGEETPILAMPLTGGHDGPESVLWRGIVEALSSRGFRRLHFTEQFPPMTGFKGHPTAEAHREMARFLCAEIRRLDLLQAP